jgi:hypothetical protein
MTQHPGYSIQLSATGPRSMQLSLQYDNIVTGNTGEYDSPQCILTL